MMLLALATLPFLAALLVPLIARAGRGVILALHVVMALMAATLLLVRAPAVFQAGRIVERHGWIPSAGLDLAFFLDPLGFLLAALILAIGLLVTVFACFYLSPHQSFGRLVALLSLFEGSMLGIAIADNLLLLVFFWELTSLSSFLLIGYWGHRADSREGARNALLVTGVGGLALLGGVLLLGQVAGSFELTAILAQPGLLRGSPLYLPVLGLILLGCFTKSAQWPFHFWLPGAMAAPTPISAYLHSATMVQAGLFLMARLWPVLSGSEVWFLLVTSIGLVTMLVGAWIAIFKTDLKAILAYSTVSHLGMIAMLLGLGSKLAAVAALFHLFNHALFKAALFLAAGIVEHQTGTRDIRRLGGLWRSMPITTGLAILAALSMAGVPLLNGFLSKEMMLEAALNVEGPIAHWLLPLLTTLAVVFSVLYSLRLIKAVFLGRSVQETQNDPGPGLFLPLLCLVIPVGAIGVAPHAVVEGFLKAGAGALLGQSPPAFSLAIWHGWTPAFFLTLLAMAVGLLGLLTLPLLERAQPLPALQEVFGRGLGLGRRLSAWAGAFIHQGSLRVYLAVFLLTALGLGGLSAAGGNLFAYTRPLLPPTILPSLTCAILLAATLFVLVIQHNRLLALIGTSLVGLMVALLFVLFSAPDLALTQVAVEVVTIVLLLLALNYLPKVTPRLRPTWTVLGNAVIAILAGGGVGAALYALMRRDVEATSTFFKAMALPAGGGANIVNVILVDFRGYDTLGEITVLSIAALVIYALLQSALHGAAASRLADWPTSAQAGDSHPLLLVVLTRLLLPMAFLVGLYLFLRGHQAPGGGFVAGLVIGIALVLQYMASGYAWASRRLTVDYHGLLAGGVLTALVTGLIAVLTGRPYLTSGLLHLDLPFLGEVELASALAFDAGIFITVVGVVLLILAGLSRIARLAEPAGRSGPMTVALDRGENRPHRRIEPLGHAPVFGSQSGAALDNEQDGGKD